MKPGLKTTEFWGLILGFGLVVLGGLTVDQNLVTFKLDLELSKWWLGLSLGYVGSRAYVKGAQAKKE